MTPLRSVLLTILAVALFAIGHFTVPVEVLHKGLIRVFGLSLPLHGLLLLSVALFILFHERRTLVAHRRLIAAGLLLGVLSATLAATVAPPGHRLYFDEDIYAQIGVSIARAGRAGMIDLALPDGDAWQGVRYSINKEPNGFPFLVAVVTWIAGIRDNAGTLVNLASLLAAPLGFLLLHRELTVSHTDQRSFAQHTTHNARRLGGLGGALLLALWPELLRWGATGAIEPAAASLAIWSIFLAARAGRTGDHLDAILAALLAALTIQVRPEGFLLLLPMAAAFLRKGAPWSFALPVLAVTLLPHALLMSSMSGESWGAAGPKFTLETLPLNTSDNVWYWLTSTVRGTVFAPPRLVAILALLGASALAVDAIRARRARAPENPACRRLLVLAAWGVPSFAIFLPFYAGSYFYGADVRFSLLVLAPIALLAGEAIDRAARGAFRAVPFAMLRAVAERAIPPVVALLLLAGPLLELGVITHEARQSRSDHTAVARFAAQLPKDAIVIAHSPTMWAMQDKPAIQLAWLMRRPKLIEHLAQRFPLYYHVSYWDIGLSRHPRTSGPFAGLARGDDLLARFPSTLVSRVEAEADWVFELRRLEVGNAREEIQPVFTIIEQPLEGKAATRP